MKTKFIFAALLLMGGCVSRKEYHRNLEKQDDFSRMIEAVKGAEGKRLTYRVVN